MIYLIIQIPGIIENTATNGYANTIAKKSKI